MTKETGGSAFPVIEQRNEYSGEVEVYADAGMNLRDWFAGQALQGICAAMPSDIKNGNALVNKVYEIADAMIKTRKS